MFFFGCWNEDGNFLYKDFWLNHSQNNGVLSEAKGGGFYVALSRDQPEKVYVQHKMREHSERVWSLLAEGAAVYIAGIKKQIGSLQPALHCNQILRNFLEINLTIFSRLHRKTALR
ncbi:hypothetical protein RYX36_006250 [Vicia faba]